LLSGLLLGRFTGRFRKGLLGRFAGRFRKGFLSRCEGASRSKFGQTHGRGREVQPKIKTKVPDPLIQDLPELLATSRPRTPPIRILFHIFIGEDRLKGAAMQIQIKHISTGEGRARCGGEKEFIDRLCSQDSDGWFVGGGGWVRRNNQANPRSRGTQCDVRTIEEGPACSTLRMSRVVIWR